MSAMKVLFLCIITVTLTHAGRNCIDFSKCVKGTLPTSTSLSAHEICRQEKIFLLCIKNSCQLDNDFVANLRKERIQKLQENGIECENMRTHQPKHNEKSFHSWKVLTTKSLNSDLRTPDEHPQHGQSVVCADLKKCTTLVWEIYDDISNENICSTLNTFLNCLLNECHMIKLPCDDIEYIIQKLEGQGFSCDLTRYISGSTERQELRKAINIFMTHLPANGAAITVFISEYLLLTTLVAISVISRM